MVLSLDDWRVVWMTGMYSILSRHAPSSQIIRLCPQTHPKVATTLCCLAVTVVQGIPLFNDTFCSCPLLGWPIRTCFYSMSCWFVCLFRVCILHRCIYTFVHVSVIMHMLWLTCGGPRTILCVCHCFLLTLKQGLLFRWC